MKKKTALLLFTFYFLLFTSSMAQKHYNYDTAWKSVETFQQKGLPKSALEVVNRIYTQAKAEKAEAQQVKALVYQSQLTQQTSEGAWQKNISLFEKEAASATEPVKQILYSITADLYYSCFQQQRYRIYNRTNTSGDFKKDDPATWTIPDFHTKIAELYEKSLQNTTLLQQTALDKYDPIIIKGNVRKLRPTLYDLLAWKALDYFKTDEYGVTQPAYAFEINDMAALAAAPIFIRYEYKSKDSNSHELKALQIFQQLLSFHRNDKDKAAFVDADIQRATWVYGKSVTPDKDQLYKELLEQIYNTNKDLPEAMQAGYLLAQWYQQKGNGYIAGTGNPDNKNALVIAAQYAKEVAAKFPESEGGINAANLLKEITKPTLNMQVEKVNVPNEPFRALVQFKNFMGLNLRIILYNDEVEKGLTAGNAYNGSDLYWQRLVALSATKTWQQAFPKTDDYRQHSAEIKVDGLPVGKYLLLSSVDPKFSLSKNPLAVATFYVSNISYVIQDRDCFVLNRTDGQPLAGAKVKAAYYYYDYDSRKNKTSTPFNLTADKNGFVQIPELKDKKNRYNQENLQLDISYGTDRLEMQENNYRTYYREDEVAKETTAANFEEKAARWFIYTDRSIYRPGQTVYFKTIGVTQDFITRKSKLYLPKDSVTIVLNDVNGQQVDSLELKVNEWGSISGHFKVPATGLTGRFTIKVDDKSQQSISVEEYKRPRFFVEYEKQKGSYRLNDEITVTGNAKAYAGNNVDGANVSYRVYRNTRWLYPWVFYKRGIWPPQGRSRTEITHGDAKTDADGQFKITFTAQPDLSLDQSLDPTFDYTVEADVTDISGETRSGNTTVSVGYKSLQLSLGLQDAVALATDSLKKIPVSVTNLAGEPQTAQTTLKIFELVTPTRLLRERYWQAPDTTVMDELAFRQTFPYDPYRNEGDYRTWNRGKLLLEDTFTTGAGKSYTLKKELQAGWYAIEATAKNKDGKTVTTVSYVPLYDAKTGKLPAPDYAFTAEMKTDVEPGDKAIIYAGSSAENVFVVQQTLKANTQDETKPVSTYQFGKMNNNISREEFAVTEADRGGYTVNRFYIKQNRVYTQSWNITVPWSNKELDITYETFRDKLLPGAEEKWKVKIKGWKGEKAAAEMLVSMYDASLNQFQPHSWNKPDIWPIHSFENSWSGENNFGDVQSQEKYWNEYGKYFEKRYDILLNVNQYGVPGGGGRIVMRGTSSVQADVAAAPVSMERLNETVVVGYAAVKKATKIEYNAYGNNPVHTKFPPSVLDSDDDGIPDEVDKQPNSTPDLSTVAVRTNLQETAFFFPDLHTDADGNVEFSFTMPEALTQWKLQTLAHTKALAFGLDSRTTVTQKDLMVQPNAPRFFREGDNLELSAKISNLTGKELTGQAQLLLFNTATNQSVDGWFKNVFPNQYFTVPAGGSIAVKFPMEVPYNYGSALTYRIVAKAGNVSDGEESAAPVLTNRMLVTKSFPLNLRNTTEKHFTWDKLLNSKSSASGDGFSTLTNQSLTVEFTTNPTWYAVQALPYLMEYPYECAEQTWNRLYANALAAKIANSTPKIKAIFDRWKFVDSVDLQSNLDKNPELKQALLEETPWVLDAKNEIAQKLNIALLFDMVKLSSEAAKSLGKLKELQSSNGGFVWFKGGPDDRYITQYIVSAIGHLRKLGVLPQNANSTVAGSLSSQQQTDVLAIAQKAASYLDARLKEEYDNLIRYKVNLKGNNLSSIAIQYLYAKSFFPEWKTAAASQTAVTYFSGQAKQYWLSRGKYEQGMIALAFFRNGDAATANAILKSLKENSISSEEFGMYWKEFNTGGYYWWQSPIESHALLTEAFAEIEKNDATTNDLKTWLLKQKQTQNWRTTKATADACYALLMQGSNWLNVEQTVTIKLGNTTLSSNDPQTKAEAGTGYFKQKIDGSQVKSEMGNITVQITPVGAAAMPGPLGLRGTSWGAVYWQYFENLDKITFAATPLQLKKQLFIQTNGDRGPVLTPVVEGTELKVGDKIKVRIELRVDRNMEYVHLKDMRAACLEPVNVLSGYKYQDGLGYYESTRDASTNFFFSYLNKGTYVFEYPLTVTHSGNFSNGITSIQCMYAPEFTAHSEGIRIQVKD